MFSSTTSSSAPMLPSASSRSSPTSVAAPSGQAMMPSADASVYIARTISSSLTASAPPPVSRMACKMR